MGGNLDILGRRPLPPLDPGDAGYIGWALALQEYFVTVVEVLKEYGGV